MLLSGSDSSSPSCFVDVNRTAVDVLGGLLGGIRRAVIEGRLKRETERLFAIQRTRIERNTPSAVAKD